MKPAQDAIQFGLEYFDQGDIAEKEYKSATIRPNLTKIVYKMIRPLPSLS